MPPEMRVMTDPILQLILLRKLDQDQEIRLLRRQNLKILQSLRRVKNLLITLCPKKMLALKAQEIRMMSLAELRETIRSVAALQEGPQE